MNLGLMGLKRPAPAYDLERINPYRRCPIRSKKQGKLVCVGIPREGAHQEEDRLRCRNALKLLVNGVDKIEYELVDDLAKSLSYPHARPIKSNASAFGFRRFQIDISGAILRFFSNLRSNGIHIYNFTILSRKWVLKPENLTTNNVRRIVREFKNNFYRKCSLNLSGHIIARLDGEYNEFDGNFYLHFHGFCTLEMRNYINTHIRKKPAYRATDFIPRPILIGKVKDYTMQVSYISKTHWVRGYNNGLSGEDRKRWSGGRIKEPYSTIYLSVLNQLSIPELYVLRNVRVYKGHLVDANASQNEHASNILAPKINYFDRSSVL